MRMRNIGIEQHPRTRSTPKHACILHPRLTSASALSLFCFASPPLSLTLSLQPHLLPPPPSCNCSECALSPPTTLHSRPSTPTAPSRSTRLPAPSPSPGPLPQHGDQGDESPQLWRSSCSRHLLRHDGRRAGNRHPGCHHGPRPKSAQQEDHGKTGPVLRCPVG